MSTWFVHGPSRTYFELFRARSSTKIWVLIAQLCCNYCLMNNVVGNYFEHRSVYIMVSL